MVIRKAGRLEGGQLLTSSPPVVWRRTNERPNDAMRFLDAAHVFHGPTKGLWRVLCIAVLRRLPRVPCVRWSVSIQTDRRTDKTRGGWAEQLSRPP